MKVKLYKIIFSCFVKFFRLQRAILCYAKADWTNHAFGHDEWVKIKKSGLCEFEQVPVLEVDGKKINFYRMLLCLLKMKYQHLAKR